MTGSRSAIALIFGLLALCLGSAAQAQDLWEGKSPEQLFRLNCSACHRSPVGLATAGEKAGGLFGLENFLAQHYTASGRSAELIANYLKTVDGAAAQRRSRQPRRGASKPRKPAAEKADTARKSDADKADKEKAGGARADQQPKVEKAVTSDEKRDEPRAEKPEMTEPKPENAAMGAAGVKDDKNATSTGNKPSGEGAADKKTN